ncbi:hypothetical protein Q9290_01545 [Oceanimonas sp. CHS3-5]|nr:hypothetical protein [Oceanimonas sp. CHS3-5]
MNGIAQTKQIVNKWVLYKKVACLKCGLAKKQLAIAETRCRYRQLGRKSQDGQATAGAPAGREEEKEIKERKRKTKKPSKKQERGLAPLRLAA